MRSLLPFLIALPLTSCVYANVNTPLSYRAPTPNEVQGPLNELANGEACNQAVLGLVAWGDGGYAAAVEDAKRRSGARMLADVRADTRLFNVLFVYSKACTRVTGLVVR
jgi:TRL-like protein family